MRSSGGALTSKLHTGEADTGAVSTDDAEDAEDAEGTDAESPAETPVDVDPEAPVGEPPAKSDPPVPALDSGSKTSPPASTPPVVPSATVIESHSTADLATVTGVVESNGGAASKGGAEADDGATQSRAAAPMLLAAATPAVPHFHLPTPAQVFDQIRDTVTATVTKCACALVNGIRSLLNGFNSLMASGPSAPEGPAQAPALWTVFAWVRRQVDYAVAAFNRSSVGQLVHQVTEQVVDTIRDFGNSPFGRQFSARVTQFLAECSETTGLPADFDRIPIVTGLNEPTDFAILTDADDPDEIHRIFITEKSGSLKSYDPHTGQVTTLVSVPVVTAAGERGLIGIEVDPHFWNQGQEGYHTVYIAYTGADNHDRLSSLLVNDALDSTVETELVRSTLPAGEFHHGGELAFDPQGQYLYWGVGNNNVSANSQDLSNIHGKILRLNRDGTAPADNPFVGDPTADPHIFAYGFRNPFRFAFTPDGKLLAGDVGESTWEELNLVTAGGNYGWPDAEGFCDGCGYVNPIYAYHHEATSGSGSITSVAIYSGDSYPASYQNTVFIGDYSLGWIKQLTFDSEYSSLISEKTFDTGAGPVVKLAQGPGGNLYQLNIYPGTLSVIAPSGGNRAPTAVIGTSATSGAGDSLSVDFTAGGSSDPDGDNLTYRWDFGGGRTSTEANPTVTFTNAAEYTAYQVTLTVSDGVRQSTATQRIVVGSTPPSATVNVDQNTYDAGDTIVFSATALDPEDGALPDSAYQWKVEFHHADHLHPFLDNIVGPTGSITIPRNTDQLSNTYYRIILTVTDSSGLATTKSVDVHPNLVTLVFSSNNSNATYTIDGIPHKGTYTDLAVVGVERTLNAASPQYVGGQRLEFGGWSDNGAQNHVIVTPGTDANYQVIFNAVPSAAVVV